MKSAHLTLVTDGPFDRVLNRHIDWLARRLLTEDSIVRCRWADLRALPAKPRGLAERIRYAVELYPCDLLVVHRDSETAESEPRFAEIREALTEARYGGPAVAVVPVRMTEAWLLFDHQAIRTAAGNPNSSCDLELRDSRWDQLPDAKGVLHEALRKASELAGRRRKKFHATGVVHLVAEYIDDFSPLLQLPAFARFEADLRNAFQTLQWM